MPVFLVLFSGLLAAALAAASYIFSRQYLFLLSLSSGIVFGLTLIAFALVKKVSSRAFVPCIAAASVIIIYACYVIFSGFSQTLKNFWLIYILLIVPAITFLSWALSLIAGLILDSFKKN